VFSCLFANNGVMVGKKMQNFRLIFGKI